MPEKIIILLVFLLGAIDTIISQDLVQISGTRLKLTLAEEFKKGDEMGVFVSDIDSTILSIIEITNPYTFEELIQKRLSNLLLMQFDTTRLITMNYLGYDAVQYNFNHMHLESSGQTLNFGSDSFLVTITIENSNQKAIEFDSVILNVEYDKNLEIDNDLLRGFTISNNGTNLKVFKEDSHTIHFREHDSNGNLVSLLNVANMPKSYHEGLKQIESIDLWASHYFPESNYVTTKTKKVAKEIFIFRIYNSIKGLNTEYQMVGIIERKESDILFLSSVIEKKKMKSIYKIINTLKFKTADNFR